MVFCFIDIVKKERQKNLKGCNEWSQISETMVTENDQGVVVLVCGVNPCLD